MKQKQSITPKTHAEAYDLVLTFFYVDGKRHGAKAALAKAVGVTRAAVNNWEHAGFPIKHIQKLKDLTGLRGKHILPELGAMLD